MLLICHPLSLRWGPAATYVRDPWRSLQSCLCWPTPIQDTPQYLNCQPPRIQDMKSRSTSLALCKTLINLETYVGRMLAV